MRHLLKESYHKFREIYSNYPFAENNKLQNIVTEDSNSGYQFFSKVFKNSNVISANGNGNIIKTVNGIKSGDILVIADGAAFGALIENCIDLFKTKMDQRISLWMPESFEYLILKSGVISSEILVRILSDAAEYVDCQKYESWERFFTAVLIELTAEGQGKYSKEILNDYYLQSWVVEKIRKQIPVEIKIG